MITGSEVVLQFQGQVFSRSEIIIILMIATFIIKVIICFFARAEFSAPLFKSGMTRLEDVKPGEILTGRY